MEYIARWRTSSRSSHAGQCVEARIGCERVDVRDTKDRAAGYFTVAAQQWGTFVTAIKRGDFDS